jgi:hypothetical protein
MNQEQRELWAVIVFGVGGAMLLYMFYSILDNVGKPWIDQRSFLWVQVAPFGFLSFALIGAGLLLIIQSQKESAKT